MGGCLGQHLVHKVLFHNICFLSLFFSTPFLLYLFLKMVEVLVCGFFLGGEGSETEIAVAVGEVTF